jgi:hypothetical protein
MNARFFVTLRRQECERRACPHLATNLFDDPYASCPAGHWPPIRKTESSEPALPSKLTMTRNAGAAVVQAVRSRGKKVSDEEFERRTAICKGGGGIARCDSYRPSDNRCSECGCRLKYKPRLEAWHCPLEKW